MNKSKLPVMIVLLSFSALLGFLAGRSSLRPASSSTTGGTASGAEQTAQQWTCSMHPQIKMPLPGKCPICGMQLVPVRKSGGSGGDDVPRRLVMTPAAAALAGIRTSPVVRRVVDVELEFNGTIRFDEGRVKTISSWVAGRLDRLFVDYTGVPVRKGDHLVEIYSPELYSAQEELIQASRAFAEAERSGSSRFVRASALETLKATRDKLRLLGMNAGAVAAIERRGKPSAHVLIKAPIGGIVIRKLVEEGDYVKTGQPIYKVADLARLWVELDVYESSLAWIRYGQKVDIRTVAYGDRVFKGWISFIDPLLDPETRSVKVRVVVDNRKGLLRPNMFVKAVVRASMGAGDRIVTSSTARNWICPMHPEESSAVPGKCPVCSMPMESAESLGYSSSETAAGALVVPASAVLYTGRRGVVYVRVPRRAQPTFDGIEVELGPRAGDYYIIRSGLEEGQQVVTNGQFKIDSSLQIQARPSMMGPGGGSPMTGHSMMNMGGGKTKMNRPIQGKQKIEGMSSTGGSTDESRVSLSSLPGDLLQAILDGYEATRKALADDDSASAAAAAARLASLGGNPGTGAGGTGGRLPAVLGSALSDLGRAKGLQEQRLAFRNLSDLLISALRKDGGPRGRTLGIFHCPMAFGNRGADWLQEDAEVSNPYLGRAMLLCGEKTGTVPVLPSAGEGGTR